MIVNFNEEVFDYELITYEPERRWKQLVPERENRFYRFTEREAHEKNQAYGINQVPKRLVRVKPRKINAY